MSAPVEERSSRRPPDEPYPPPYLIAAYLSLVLDSDDAVTYCESSEHADGVQWVVLGIVGGRVIRLKVTGPALDPTPPPHGRRPQATEMRASALRPSAVDSLSVHAEPQDQFGTDLGWKSIWTVRFADGDEIAFQGASGLKSEAFRADADALAEKFLSLLST